MKNLSKIRKSLDTANTTTAHAFVTSKLDYSNSLVYGLPAYQIRRLQVVQNAAAHVVAKIRKYDRITHIRKELQGLPVKVIILRIHNHYANMENKISSSPRILKVIYSDQGL